MNRIGVADDEEFEAKNFNEKVFRTYKFSKCKVYELSDSGDWYEIFTWYFDFCTVDCLNRCIGNCFRTKKSAEANKEKILKMLKGEDDE